MNTAQKTLIMKNLLLSTLLLVSITTGAFATGESNISYFILNTFKHDFRDATNVNWIARADYSKASFLYKNQKMEVFYNSAGQRLAVSKSIQLDELPVGAKRAFAKKFEGYTVKEAILYEGTDEESYYVSAENDKEKVIIKIGQNEQLTFFQKTKK
jgi:hypothetical protein